MGAVRIGNRLVGYDQPCFVVAEIGINHNGDVVIANQLIDVSHEAGCEAVKFQKRTVPIVYIAAELAKPREVKREVLGLAIARGVLAPEAVERLTKSDFQNSTNGDLKWALELTAGEYREIDAHCRAKGIMWFASPWDEAAVDFLETFNPPCYKIASASLTDDGLLRHIRANGKPVILSTGMSTMDEVRHAVEVLGEEDLILLHTVSTYPAKSEELNLRMVETLRHEFPDVPIGYSGHEAGVSPSVMATVLGACMVERHVTLNRTMWGSDHAASLEPEGIRRVVRDIRTWEAARGDGVKRVLPSEESIKKKLRRK